MFLISYLAVGRMSATRVLFTSVACMMFIAMLLGDFQSAEARYLPTRSNSDRLDKLRELLKEVSKMHKVQRRPLSPSATKPPIVTVSVTSERDRERGVPGERTAEVAPRNQAVL